MFRPGNVDYFTAVLPEKMAFRGADGLRVMRKSLQAGHMGFSYVAVADRYRPYAGHKDKARPTAPLFRDLSKHLPAETNSPSSALLTRPVAGREQASICRHWQLPKGHTTYNPGHTYNQKWTSRVHTGLMLAV